MGLTALCTGRCAWGQEAAGPVALKMSLYPWDARFAREAELLSRLSHPSVPPAAGPWGATPRALRSRAPILCHFRGGGRWASAAGSGAL